MAVVRTHIIGRSNAYAAFQLVNWKPRGETALRHACMTSLDISQNTFLIYIIYYPAIQKMFTSTNSLFNKTLSFLFLLLLLLNVELSKTKPYYYYYY